MKRQQLEVVRLGQGDVRHVCLPPDHLLNSLLESMSLDDGGGRYVHPDARYLQQHRALCGRYGKPNAAPFTAPVYGRQQRVDPAFFPVCRICALSLAELEADDERVNTRHGFRRQVEVALRKLRERQDGHPTKPGRAPRQPGRKR